MKKNKFTYFTPEEDAELLKLCKTDMFYTEMSVVLGRTATAISYRARKLGVGRRLILDRFGKWNNKHAHMRGDVMKYFLTHTWDETQKHFGLRRSELKSLFTVGYRMPEFAHLRKETRNHNPWSSKDLKILLRHAGLVPRKYILNRLEKTRGATNVCTIKERMQALGIASRNIQGITVNQFITMFGSYPEFYLRTLAGPPGHEWGIVPWVHLDEQFKKKKLKTTSEISLYVDSMARFQTWIFEGNPIPKMKRICSQNIFKGGS